MMAAAAKKRKRPPERFAPEVKKTRGDFVPHLNRYKNFRSSKGVYTPFDFIPEVCSEYFKKGEDVQRLVNHHLVSFLNVFMNIPPGNVSKEFREEVIKRLEKDWPKMRCSSMRAVFEGRIPGLPNPHRTSYIPGQNRIKLLFLICDLMDTVVATYLEELEKGIDQLGEGALDAPQEADAEEGEEDPEGRHGTGEEANG